jgi:hypothetical protein
MQYLELKTHQGGEHKSGLLWQGAQREAGGGKERLPWESMTQYLG